MDQSDKFVSYGEPTGVGIFSNLKFVTSPEYQSSYLIIPLFDISVISNIFGSENPISNSSHDMLHSSHVKSNVSHDKFIVQPTGPLSFFATLSVVIKFDNV